MKLLPFLSFVLLATFAQSANSQTPIPSPFWKDVKPKEEIKKEEKLTMQIMPAVMACSDEKTFGEFVKRKGYDFSSFNGTSEMMENTYVLFFHNEKTNEFSIVRTDGKGSYCIIEIGKQNLDKIIGPINYEK